MSRQIYRWQASPTTLSVAAAVTVALAPPGTLTTKITLFAALSNTTFIAIGPSNMTVAVGARPNVAQFQLDAGRSAQMYVTRPELEDFDLGKLFAAHNDAATAQILFVTVWNIQGGAI